MQPVGISANFQHLFDSLAAWWCDFATGIFAPVLAALGLACPAVPLDPHYAPLFVVGNAWTYKASDSFLRDDERPGFDGLVTCTVTKVETKAGTGGPTLVASVQCAAKNRKPTYLDTTWVADGKGLRKSGWWNTGGNAFDRARPWLVLRPPMSRDDILDVLAEKFLTYAAFRKQAGPGAEYIYRESVTHHQVNVDTAGRRSVWSVQWEAPMGAGFYCTLELAEGVGPIQLERKIGSDDDDEYRKLHLVAFTPAGKPR
ncbi:MAG: hypothetical protein HY902_16140 [Deltaproteobacteria bacterium]|nr:hypothetical protein [Deltaproteobacteria bacterium]